MQISVSTAKHQIKTLCLKFGLSPQIPCYSRFTSIVSSSELAYISWAIYESDF